MFWETFEKLDLDAGDATWLHQSCCCDHCVNHLRIDLCDCGSEHKVGECECGSQKAHDTLGIKYGIWLQYVPGDKEKTSTGY